MGDLFALDRIFQTYLRKHLSRRLKFDAMHCRIVVPQEGVQTNIRLVEFAEGGGAAVRVFERHQADLAMQLYHADDLLTKHKVPAPSLLDYYESDDKRRLVFLAEQRVEGLPVGQTNFDRATVESLARTMISLHAVQSSEWGMPMMLHGKGFARDQRRKAGHRLSAIKRRAGRLIKKEEWKKVAAFIEHCRVPLEGLKVFHLIHDKINVGNIIHNPATNVFSLIDFATLQFGCQHKDLIPLYHEVLRENTGHIEQFKAVYWAAYTESERQQAEALEPFYHAYYHLAECSINLKRLAKWTSKRGLADSAFVEKFSHHWEQLMAIVGE